MDQFLLLTPQEANLRRAVYTNPAYIPSVFVLDLIREAQIVNLTFINLNTVMPDAFVNYITGIFKYVVTSTPAGAGFQTVTKIDWSDTNLIPYSGIPAYARVSGSNATTTGQALVNIAGLTLPLGINSIYEFEAVLSVSTTSVTTGTGYGINFSAAGATIEAQITGSLTTTAVKKLRMNALNTAASPFLTTSAQTGGILIKGVVVTGVNAGNLTVSHQKNTSGTATCFINSFLKAIKVN